MRVIKFRGKSKDDIGKIKKGDWLYGGIVFDNDRYWIDIPYYGNIIADKKTIGQYTGLKDKNGKEIYDGDAWEDEEGYYIVVWDEERACFCVDIYGFNEWIGEGGQECYESEIEQLDREILYFWGDVSKIEIIKNIYDNPELLEKGKNK